MRKTFVFFVLTFAFVTFSDLVNSLIIENYTFYFDVISDNYVKETIKFSFMNATNYFIFDFRNSIKDISVFENGKPASFFVNRTDEKTTIKIPVTNNNGNVEIDLTLTDVVYSNGDNKLFLTSIEVPKGFNYSITVKIPVGYKVVDYEPSYGVLSTDGSNIFVSWNISGSEEFMVKFKKANSSSSILFIFFLLFSWFVVVSIYYFKNKSFQEFLSGFDEEARKIILFIKRNRVVYQKDIVTTFNLSKVKVTRMMKRLENLGVVKRKKIGKKVKVYWNK